MSSRAALLALAARVEAAAAGSRELNEEVALATGWTHRTTRDTPGWEAPPHPNAPNVGMIMGPSCPDWTRSLDAALALKPQGWFLELEDRTWSADPHWWARLIARDDVAFGKTATPALALTAAALKALAEMESDNG